MPIKPPMQGLLDRTGWGSIPTLYRNPTSGVGGVVSNLWWGDLMVAAPASAAPLYNATIGSTHFLTDLVAIETSGTGTVNGVPQSSAGGAMTQLLIDMNGVENGGTLNGSGVNIPNGSKKLVAGSQVKIRMFTNVGAQHVFTNPPTPTWLSSQTGIFLSNDPTSNSHPYWVSGETQASEDLVVSTINGLQYTCNTSIWASNGSTNTVDPSDPSVATKWNILNPDAGAPGYSAGAGPCCVWFGNGSAEFPNASIIYLAAYSYWQLLMANTRVFVTYPNYVNAGDAGVNGSWYSGPLPQVINGVTYSIANNNCTPFTLDMCPLIGEITMSACTTIYGECCIRQISGAASYVDVTQASFLDNGYTPYQGLKSGFAVYNGPGPGFTSGNSGTASLGSGSLSTPPGPAPDSDLGQLFACQQACATAWANTCISEAHNPFQIQSFVVPHAGTTLPQATTNLISNLISVCESGQAVPGNNSPDGAPGYDNGIMVLISPFGCPAYYQTQNAGGANPGGFGNYTLLDVITQCEQVGAYNVELPGGYGSLPGVTPANLATWAATLAGYISNGTGPPGHTTVYGLGNTRTESGSPVFTNISVASTATVDTSYSGTFTCSGTPPFSFQLTSGHLPPGLVYSQTTGAITGSPTGTATASFVMTVRGDGGSQPSPTLTITVTGSASIPTFTNGVLPNMTLGVPYSFQFTATPTTPPVTLWQLGAVGSFPLGISLNPTTGLLSGTPYNLPGSNTFNINATNSAGTGTSPLYTVQVLDPIPFQSTTVALMNQSGNLVPRLLLN